MSTSNSRIRWSKWLKVLVGFFVSAGFLWWAVHDMLRNPEDRARMVTAFRKANYSAVIPLWIALLIFYWLKAWRWRLLLTPLGTFRPLADLFPPTMIGFAFNNLLPAHLGEFVRVYVFGRQHNVPKTAVLSTVVLERVFDILAIVAFLGAGLLFVDGVSPRIKQYGMVGGGLAGGLVLGALAFVIWTKPVLNLVEGILKRLPFLPASLVGKLTSLLESAADGLSALRSPVLLGGILLTSLLQWGLNGYMMHLALATFKIHVDFWVACILLGAVAFAVTIPSTPGYFGVIQWTFLGVIQLFTSDKEGVFAASIFYHLAQYIPVTLLGLYYFNRTGLRLSQVQDAAENSGPAAPQAPTRPAG